MNTNGGFGLFVRLKRAIWSHHKAKWMIHRINQYWNESLGAALHCTPPLSSKTMVTRCHLREREKKKRGKKKGRMMSISTEITKRKQGWGLVSERGSSRESGSALCLCNALPCRRVSRGVGYYRDAAVMSYLALEMSFGSTPAAWLC